MPRRDRSLRLPTPVASARSVRGSPERSAGRHELFRRIRSFLADRTVLLISHRFSSVRSADRIYVLDQGQVVENGAHDDLMQRDGLYAELFTLQAAAYLTDTKRGLLADEPTRGDGFAQPRPHRSTAREAPSEPSLTKSIVPTRPSTSRLGVSSLP